MVNATRPDERTVMTTMAGIEAAVIATDTTDPTLVLIGQALARAVLPAR